MALPDDYQIDPDYALATAEVESNFNPDAVSPAGAQGLMQIMPGTFADYAKEGQDPFNEQDSLEVGTRYLSLLAKGYNGDMQLASAAYNAGPGRVKRLREQYGDSYEDIAPHLPQETRDYVPKVTAAYQKRKAGQDVEVGAEAQADPGEPQGFSGGSGYGGAGGGGDPQSPITLPDYKAYPSSAAGFSDALLSIVQQPDFENLPYSEKAGLLNEAFYARPWGTDAFPILKDVMTDIWNSSDPEELPELSDPELLGAPPRIQEGQNAEEVLNTWQQDVRQKLLRNQISPALFGDAYDRYMKDVTEDESAAYVQRNRSIFGKGVEEVVDFGRETLKGAGYAITKPVAGVVRLLDPFSETLTAEQADAIEQFPEVLGKPARDFMYVTDDAGYLVRNEDGTPQTKWQQTIANGVGQVGALIAGGAALEAAGYGRVAIGVGFFAVNALTGANDSFKTVLEETGDLNKAYSAAAYSLPASAVGSIGEWAVVSKLANPAIGQLSDFNKAKYLANVFTRNATLGGASNAGFDLIQQYGETRQTGKAIDPSRLTDSAIFGAVASGAVATYVARNNRPVAPPPEPEPPTPQLALPPPPENPNGLPKSLPAPPGPFQYGLPEPARPLELSGPTQGPAQPINVKSESLKPDEVALGLEAFQRSKAAELRLTPEQANRIPTQFFQLFGLDAVRSTDGGILLRKRETYVPHAPEDSVGVDRAIETVQEELMLNPSPEALRALIEKRTELREAQEAERAAAVSDHLEVAERRRDLVEALNEAKNDRLTVGPERREAIRKAQADLSYFDQSHRQTLDEIHAEQLAENPKSEKTIALERTREEVQAEQIQERRKSGFDRVVKQRKKLQAELEDTKKNYETANDPLTKKVLGKELRQKEDAITRFEQDNKDNIESIRNAADLEQQIDSINSRLKAAQAETYLNDLAARERNLAALLDKRRALRQKTEDAVAGVTEAERTIIDESKRQTLEAIGLGEGASFDPREGIPVGDSVIFPAFDKWHVITRDGEIVGAYDYFHDAVRGVTEPRSLDRSFYTKQGRDRTALTPEDETAIRRDYQNEQAKKAKDAFARERNKTRSREEYEKTGPEKLSRKQQKEQAKAQRKGNAKRASSEFAESTFAAEDTTGPKAEAKTEAQPETEAESKLGTGPLGRVRLLRSRAKKPLTSNYTKPIKFAEDSTKVVRPQEIFRGLQKLVTSLNKNLRIFQGGKMRVSRAGIQLGFLNPLKNFIRVGRPNDVQTALHETLHAIDQAVIGRWAAGSRVGDYSHIPPRVQEAFRDMADTFYGGDLGGDPLLRLQEGLAMFFQHYATGQELRTEALDWYKGAFARQHPEVFKAMEALKNLSHDFYNQTPNTYQRSLILPKQTANQKRIRAIREAARLEGIKDRWVDDFNAAQDFDKLAGKKEYTNARGEKRSVGVHEILHAIRRNAHSITDYVLNEGLQDINGNAVLGLSWKQSIEPAKGKFKELEEYAIARKQIASYAQNIEPGGNLADAEKIVATTEAKHPEVVQAYQNGIKFFSHILDMVAQSSNEGAYYVAKLRKSNLETTGFAHGFYFPLPREGGGGAYSSTKARVGSTKSYLSPLQHVPEAVEAQLAKAFEYQGKEALLVMAANDVANSAGLMVREVTGNQRIGLIKDLKAQAAKELGPAPSAESVLDYMVNSKPLPGLTSKDHAILTYRDGTGLRLFEVDSRIRKLFDHSLPEVVNHWLFKYGFRLGGQIGRPAMTTLRIPFQLKNALVRDQLTAYRYIKSNEGGLRELGIYFKTLMSSFTDTARSGEWDKMIKRLGLGHSTEQGIAHEVRREVQKQYGDNLVDIGQSTLSKIEKVLSVGEATTRQAVMRMEARRLGIKSPHQELSFVDKIELINAWQRGTTHYGQQGSSARVLNMGVPFFTAHIAQVARLPGDFRRNPRKFAVLGAAMLGFGLWHALAHKDDPWWQELNIKDRLANVHWQMNLDGVEKIVKLPLDELTQMAWGIGQSIGIKATESPNLPVGVTELAKAYFGLNSPVQLYDKAGGYSQYAGVFAHEFAQQIANYDYYFEKKIVSPALEHVPAPDQYNLYTSELSKKVGGYMGWSPIKLDHALQNTVPAFQDALQIADSALGYKKAKEYGGLNWLYRAFTKSGTANSVLERSRASFDDRLLAARENRGTETPDEEQVRKKLEKLNVTLTDLGTWLYGTDDAKEKEELRLEQRQLYELGTRIANGSDETVPSNRYKRQAELQRKVNKERKQKSGNESSE